MRGQGEESCLPQTAPEREVTVCVNSWGPERKRSPQYHPGYRARGGCVRTGRGAPVAPHTPAVSGTSGCAHSSLSVCFPSPFLSSQHWESFPHFSSPLKSQRKMKPEVKLITRCALLCQESGYRVQPCSSPLRCQFSWVGNEP